jgi:hypothetical protein
MQGEQPNLHLNQLHGMDASFPVAFFLLLGNIMGRQRGIIFKQEKWLLTILILWSLDQAIDYRIWKLIGV